MRLLYMIKQPLVPRDFDRLGVGFFLERGHQVTVLDCSNWLHPDFANDRGREVSHPGMTIRRIDSRAAMIAAAGQFTTHDLVILLIQSLGPSRVTWLPLRLIARAGIPYLIQISPTYPGWNQQGSTQTLGGSIKDLARRAVRMDPLNSLVSRLPPRALGVPQAAYAVYSSVGAMRSNSLVGPATRRISAHAYDYDIYLRIRDGVTGRSDQAVFLDQYVPFHHDYRVIKAKPLDPAAYFATMRGLFERIEKELGLKVVIAAHPRADYTGMPEAFGGRQVVYGETARLVCESRLVIVHNSISSAFAVMAGKPIMVVATRALYERHPYQKHLFDSLSRDLGTPLRFIDNPGTADLSGSMSVDRARYETYLSTYSRCPDSPALPYWEIVHRALVADGFAAPSGGSCGSRQVA